LWGVGCGEGVVGSGLWGVGCGEWGVGSGLWGVENLIGVAQLVFGEGFPGCAETATHRHHVKRFA